MQNDQLLQEWKRAKEICLKIIQISKNANLYHQTEPLPMEKQTSCEFMSVYDTVYKLCITKQKEETRVAMVYKDFKDILKKALLSMLQQITNEKEIYKLVYLKKIWEAYCDILKRMVHMFAYLNRPFHIKQGRIQQLEKTGMQILVLTLFNDVTLAEFEGIYFRQLDRIRKTNDFSNSLPLKDMAEMLYKIHLKLIKNISKKAVTRYTEFYCKFLKHSKQFYEKKYSTIKQLNPSEYFEEVNKIYITETKVACQCFGIGGESIINKEFSDEFIQKYRKILLESSKGLKLILQHQQIHTLKIIIDMYTKLAKNIDGFKEQFQEFIYEDIKIHIEQIKNELLIKKNVAACCTFMGKIIEKNNQYRRILRESFPAQNLSDFVSYYKVGVEKAFATVKLPIAIEEILAIYIDAKLRFNSVEQSSVEEIVQNVMSIFMCVQNKDLFLLKYSQKLAKKLLNISPQTVKNHEQFVEYLKLNCGLKYTERIQTLFYEYSLHEEYSLIIKELMQKRNVPLNFNVKIFSEGAWPTSIIIDIPLHYFPKSIEQSYECLIKYNTQYSNKKNIKISYMESKFRWIYIFDKEAQNKLTDAYFDTNCLQGALLWLIYQKREKVSLKVIEHYFDKVNIKVLKQNLKKMVETNQNILLSFKDQEDTFYEFNTKMRSTKRLISYQLGASSQQQKLFQQQDLSKDREIVLDANIAKLMKSKRVIDFETLFSQISKMIKTFNPQKKDIKTSIERLIAKDLLQRDEKQRGQIKYIE